MATPGDYAFKKSATLTILVVSVLPPEQLPISCPSCDAGNTVTYDAHADVYHLHGLERQYVFSRKLNSNGSRSACDMAIPAHNDTPIATVADNMRQYTKREVTQATNARELMARLAHASSQETIGMVCSTQVS